MICFGFVVLALVIIALGRVKDKKKGNQKKRNVARWIVKLLFPSVFVLFCSGYFVVLLGFNLDSPLNPCEDKVIDNS